MAPGMTSAGGHLPDGLQENTVVVVGAQDKEHGVAIGLTKMTAADMKAKNKGIGVDAVHYLGDWLVR